MAAISKLRKHSVLLMIVIGGALLAFILSDLGRGSRRDSKYYNVGSVNGEKISSSDFNKEVDNITNIRSFNTDPKTLSEMSYQIRESVWNDMVRQSLLNDEYKKLGIKVTEEEMNDLIRGPEPHQYIVSNFTDPNTGELNRAQLDYIIQNLNNSSMVPATTRDYYLYLESAIKKETEESKYNNLISKGYYIPNAFAEKEYKEKNTNYDVAMVARKFKDYPDSLFSVSNAELSKYYNSHKEEYKTDETRNIAYVIRDIVPTQEDRTKLVSNVNDLYKEFVNEENIGQFLAAESEITFDTTWKKRDDLISGIAARTFDANPNYPMIAPFTEGDALYFGKVLAQANRPDSLRASHILIAYNGAYNSSATRTKEQAKATADSLANVLRKNSSNFADLASQMSDDPSAKENKGDLDWFTDGAMVYPFNEYVINNKIGSIGVVETIFGYHVIKVDDKTPAIPKAQVAIFQRNIVPSNETYQREYMDFSAFAANCKNFDELMLAASDKGYNIKYFDNAQRMSDGISGIPGTREVVRWAFEDNTKANQISRVYDLTDKLLVASVTDIHPQGYLSLEDVKSRITPLVIRNKKADKANAELKEMMQGCSSLEQLASKLNTTIDSAVVSCNISNLAKYGSEPKVIGSMFAASENQIVGPVAGDQASYIFVKTLKSNPEEKTDFTADRQRQESIMANRFKNMVVKTLQDNSKIDDNRFLYY